MTVFLIPLAVQWWSTWYPGSEPGGGGYIAQRMLASRNEKEAMASTLWFNIAHYALRPWPWILVALASLIVYPTLGDIQARFPHLDPAIVRHDLAYPAMLVFLPHGMLGLVVASLAAAYMSTISTHLNWGASYLVDDFYHRFLVPAATEAHYVNVGRAVTFFSMVLSALVALWLENAMQAFQILLQIGAGTGLIFLLRWYWWRINAWSEIAAMAISFLVALYFQFGHQPLGFEPLHPSLALLAGVLTTTLGWLVATFATPPTDRATLQAFYDRIRPAPGGWRGAVDIGDDRGDGSVAAGIPGLVSRLPRRLCGVVRHRLPALWPNRPGTRLRGPGGDRRLRPLPHDSEDQLLAGLTDLTRGSETVVACRARRFRFAGLTRHRWRLLFMRQNSDGHGKRQWSKEHRASNQKDDDVGERIVDAAQQG